MRQMLLAVVILAMQCQPALASDEPLSFKVKYRTKQIALFLPRWFRNVIVHDDGLRGAVYSAWTSEAYNMRCRGQSCESFEFWSWGD